MLKAAFEVGRSRGQAASFLRPASQGLADYYTQFGYRPFFGFLERRKSLSNASVRVPGLELFPVRDYGAARERVLADGPPHIVWEKRWADLALEQAEAAGGGGFSFAGSAGCALCEPDGDALFVRELLCPASQTDACMSALLSRFGRTGIVLPDARPGGRRGNGVRPLASLLTMTDGNSSGPLRGINRIWGWR